MVQCIVFHDDRLERTTDGSGAIANTPFETIAALDAGAWFAPEFVGERVPRLEEVIAELVALDLYPDIEIKPCPGREIETAKAALTTIKSHWPSGRDGPLLTSFALPCLEVARDLAPNWPRGLICLKPPADWPIKLSSVDAMVLVCHENGLLPKRRRSLSRARNRRCNLSDQRWRLRCSTLGMGCIITNQQLARSVAPRNVAGAPMIGRACHSHFCSSHLGADNGRSAEITCVVGMSFGGSKKRAGNRRERRMTCVIQSP